MSLTILSLRPDLLNVNGDAENARVLAKRAEWAGLDAEVVTEATELPSAIVIGSGYDGDLAAVLDALRPFTGLLERSIAADVPVVAVAMGLHILGTRLETESGEWVDGLGILDGESVLAATRSHGDLVVESGFGTLVGFENHSRSWVSKLTPLGTVVSGHGNSEVSGTDGVLSGSVIGTHLRGPLLARNPAIADHILRIASNGRYSEPGTHALAADQLAAASRAKTLASR